MAWAIVILITAAAVFGLIILNVWYSRQRAKMTQEEREQEMRDMGVW